MSTYITYIIGDNKMSELDCDLFVNLSTHLFRVWSVGVLLTVKGVGVMIVWNGQNSDLILYRNNGK